MTYDATDIDQADDRENLDWDQFKNDSGLYKTHDDDAEDDDPDDNAGNDDANDDAGENDANVEVWSQGLPTGTLPQNPDIEGGANAPFIHNVPIGFSLVCEFDAGEANQPWDNYWNYEGGEWTVVPDNGGDTWESKTNINDQLNDINNLTDNRYVTHIAPFEQDVKANKIVIIHAQCAAGGSGKDVFRYVMNHYHSLGNEHRPKYILLSPAKNSRTIGFWLKCGFKMFLDGGELWMATLVQNPSTPSRIARMNSNHPQNTSPPSQCENPCPDPFQMLEKEGATPGNDCPVAKWMGNRQTRTWWDEIKISPDDDHGGVCRVNLESEVSHSTLKNFSSLMSGTPRNGGHTRGKLRLFLLDSVYGVLSRHENQNFATIPQVTSRGSLHNDSLRRFTITLSGDNPHYIKKIRGTGGVGNDQTWKNLQ